MRDALEAEWLHLTREALPALAKTGRWPIRLDHCWQRVLLDNACGGVWYKEISGRPTYKAASTQILGEAVELCRKVVRGDADPSALNRQSLGWRGK